MTKRVHYPHSVQHGPASQPDSVVVADGADRDRVGQADERGGDHQQCELLVRLGAPVSAHIHRVREREGARLEQLAIGRVRGSRSGRRAVSPIVNAQTRAGCESGRDSVAVNTAGVVPELPSATLTLGDRERRARAEPGDLRVVVADAARAVVRRSRPANPR